MQINRNWILTRTLIVFLLLISPLIEGLLIQGVDRYKNHQEMIRKLDYIGETIYRKAPPLDLVFMGPSSMWASINAGIIEKELRLINKKENIFVENFSHNHIGTDLDFIILKDLIENRGVKALFLGMPPIRQKTTHRHTRYIWNPTKHYEGQSLKTFTTLYSEKLLDSIPNLIRHYILRPKAHPKVMAFIKRMNGSLIQFRPYVYGKEIVPYQHIEMPPLKLSLSDVLKSPTDESVLSIMDFLPYQEHFVREIIKLTTAKNIDLYFLSPPTDISDYKEKRFKILTLKDNTRVPVKYLGLHISTLFPKGDINEVKKFYFDTIHTNRNGSEYYTRSLIQPLQEIYEKTNH